MASRDREAIIAGNLSFLASGSKALSFSPLLKIYFIFSVCVCVSHE